MFVGVDAPEVGVGSRGVVAIVYPIHAAMARIKATARKAVICRVINGQSYTNQA